jgi:hypothetical protein
VRSQLPHYANAYMVERRQRQEVAYNVLGEGLKDKGEYDSHLQV